MKTIFALLLVMSLADVALAKKAKKGAKLAAAQETVQAISATIEPLPVIKPPEFAPEEEVSCHGFFYFEHANQAQGELVKWADSSNAYSLVDSIVALKIGEKVKNECQKAFNQLGIASKATVKVTCVSTPIGLHVRYVDGSDGTKVTFKDTKSYDCLYLVEGRSFLEK